MSKLTDDPILFEIYKTRFSLLQQTPFFGNLIIRLEPKPVAWCPTIATDGRKLYYNREFIKALTRNELKFVFCHEVLHLAFDHLGRKQGRDPDVWGMASDYLVNSILKKQSIGEMPPTALYSDKYNDSMTTEEIYEDLMKNSVEIKETIDQHLKFDGTDGDGEGEDGEDGDGNGSPKTASARIVGGPDGPPVLSEEEQQRIKNDLRTAMIQASQSCKAGDIPAGVARLINELTNPVMDWRALLENHIKSAVKGDYTFARPSKRSWTLGLGSYSQYSRPILPSQDFEDTISAAVVIDTSGSMTNEMIRDILSEIKGIMEEFSDFKLTIWTFDCNIYNPVVFTPENIDDILTYDARGGGGTDFEINWAFMKDPAAFGFDEMEEFVPERLVFFTDGYPCGHWCPPGDEEYCDTLWVLHGTKSIKAPFGQTAYYEEAKEK